MHFMLPDAMRATPRKLPFFDRFSYLKLEPPEWAATDDLKRFFRHYRKSLTHGRLVLAATIQVNSSLFEPGKYDAPGEVVYDLDGTLEPGALIQLARRLHGLRTAGAEEPQAKRIGAYLENERVRAFGWPVPPGWAPESCRISTVYFPRKHLPGGYLQEKLLPVCVDPENGVAAVFPVKYWS